MESVDIMNGIFLKVRLAADVILFFLRLIWRLAPISFLLAILSGVLHRLFSILSFVISLKAILVALNPGSSADVIQATLTAANVDINIDHSDVIVILALSTIFSFVLNYFFLHLSSVFVSRIKAISTSVVSTYNLPKVLAAEDAYRQLSLHDAFVYVKFDVLIGHFIRVSQILMFVVLFFVIILSFSWPLALATLVLSGGMMAVIVMLDKSRLQKLADIQNLKSTYLESLKASDEPIEKAVYGHTKREEYILKKQKYDKRKVQKDNLHLIFLGLAIAAIVVMVGTGEWFNLSSQTFLIFLVFSIRYLFNYGRELGLALSALLDFRAHLSKVEEPKLSGRERKS
ncbi:hypothetical protein ACSHT0_09925 [Tepidicaulis sp. LMO-SS28]|uniref:hypothetical protein n=1 Tax=Tepidicaulis sp. LMO-SS28 TaxID=3447455 RepID=UPI003EE33F32